MRRLMRIWTCWFGQRVHPLRFLLESLGLAWALWPTVILFSIFLGRLTYAMDIEWCEGGILYQAYRLLHGLPIYVRHDPIWTAWSYPIAHTAVLALVGLVELDFWTGRLISVLFFGLLCATLYREIYLHLGRSSFGMASGALAVATIACAFPVVGQWYDLVRVDTMMMALCVVGIARANQRRASWRHALITAAVLTASVYTKQTAAFFVAWVCMFATVREPRLGLRLGGVTGVMCLVVLGLLQWGTDGNYWFWTVTDLKNQTVDDARLVDGLRQLWKFAPFIALIPFGFLLVALRGLLSARTVLWTGSLLMALPASLLPYAKVGGYLNNLMPMVVMIGAVTVLLAADVAKSGGVRGALARWGLLFGLGLFVWVRPLERKKYVPTETQRQAAQELSALVGSLKGGVLVPELAFLPARTGHTNPHWYTMAVYCAEWSGRPMKMALAVEKSGARWVILHSKDVGELASYVRSRFKLSQRIPDTARVQMLTGAGIVLDELWEKLP